MNLDKRRDVLEFGLLREGKGEREGLKNVFNERQDCKKFDHHRYHYSTGCRSLSDFSIVEQTHEVRRFYFQGSCPGPSVFVFSERGHFCDLVCWSWGTFFTH